MVDHATVTPEDMGKNFFVPGDAESASLGKSLSRVVTEHLNELNPDVCGHCVEEVGNQAPSALLYALDVLLNGSFLSFSSLGSGFVVGIQPRLLQTIHVCHCLANDNGRSGPIRSSMLGVEYSVCVRAREWSRRTSASGCA